MKKTIRITEVCSHNEQGFLTREVQLKRKSYTEHEFSIEEKQFSGRIAWVLGALTLRPLEALNGLMKLLGHPFVEEETIYESHLCRECEAKGKEVVST